MSNFMHLRMHITDQDIIEVDHYKKNELGPADSGFTTIRVGNIFNDVTFFVYPDQLNKFIDQLRKVVDRLESL